MNFPTLMETIRERIKNLTRDRNRYLHPDDQARLSWAQTAGTYAEVPEIYHSFFDALPAKEKEPFPYTVISPTFKGFFQPENEKLITRVGDSLWVLEQQQTGGLETRRYPLSGIFLLETGTILLNSWFTLRGLDSSGAPASSTMRFNSVTEHLFAPFVENFRAAHKSGEQPGGPAAETSPFDALADINFKFMNYGRKTVPPGETVLQFVLQPEIRRTVFAFLGFALTRLVEPAHMVILTERELIWIRDDPTRQVKARNLHGAIWNYIPLAKIASVAWMPVENGLFDLSVQLPGPERVDISYEPARKFEVEKLRKQVSERIRQ